MEYDLSLRFLENALTINTKYHGSRSLKVALRLGEISYLYTQCRFFTALHDLHFGCHVILLFSHHLVARVYESKAEFRSALQHEKEGYTIYKNQVGLYATEN